MCVEKCQILSYNNINKPFRLGCWYIFRSVHMHQLREVSDMSVYKINIDKKVLRLLGAQLYGDTPSIISELVQNAYDADATKVWITINTTAPNSIVVADNGIGMTPDEVNDRFLNIGQDRRIAYPLSPSGRKVLGRKGIGKLAVFSLAKVIDVFSKKNGQIAACRLDFDEITLNDADPMSLDEKLADFQPAYLSKQGTGTRIELHNVQKDISKSLNYIINRLVRTYEFRALATCAAKLTGTAFPIICSTSA